MDVAAAAFTSEAARLGTNAPHRDGRRTEYACHVGLEDGRPIDVLSLSFLLDGLPPPVMLLCLPRFTWVPTLQLHTQFRARPREGTQTVRLWHRTSHVVDGMLDTDCDAYDEDGRILATSRQLAMMMPIRK